MRDQRRISRREPLKIFQTSAPPREVANCAHQMRPGRPAVANLQPTSIVPMRTVAFLERIHDRCTPRQIHDTRLFR